MASMRSISRVGIYADVANMYANGGKKMRYDVLREFACRDNAEPVRLNAYVTYDSDRAEHDEVYKDGALSFHSALRDYGYKVITKDVKWYQDDSGTRYGKANADLDLAVDALLQSENLDRVLIASGDGDFVQVVRALQNRGCRVEVVSLDNASADLRREADLFLSGYLIPNMIPIAQNLGQGVSWGEVDSLVRGWCYWYDPERGFGYMRYLKAVLPGLWLTDARHPESPWGTAYFRESYLPAETRATSLPSRNHIFQFRLTASDRGDNVQASEIELVSRLSGAFGA